MSETLATYSSAIGQFVIGLSPIGAALASDVTLEVIPPDIARLYDNVQGILPAITLPLIRMELWNVVQEFCIRSTYFRARVQWQMPIGMSSVDFNPFSSDLVVTWVLETYGLTDWGITPPAMLTDYQQPMAARSGWAMLCLRPIRFDETQLACLPELFTTWWEAMLDGVLFRLYGQPAKPWSSPQLAQYHGTRYRQALNRARDIAERLHSSQQSPARKFPYFAKGRRKN